MPRRPDSHGLIIIFPNPQMIAGSDFIVTVVKDKKKKKGKE